MQSLRKVLGKLSGKTKVLGTTNMQARIGAPVFIFLLFIGIAAGLVYLSPKTASATPSVLEYNTTTASSYPTGMTTGSDGASWFTEYVQNKIGRIASNGTVTEYSDPSSGPYGITSGPGNALWFAGSSLNEIGRITTGGTITNFPISATLACPAGSPQYVTTGSDGNVWFTDSNNCIGKMTPAGVVTEYPLPSPPSNGFQLAGLTLGSDGNVWFTEYNNASVGSITPGGIITQFKLPSGSSFPYSITSGPDGALWFTELSAQIGRITTSGSISEFSTPSAAPYGGITTGSDGALWFTQSLNDSIGRMTTTGYYTTYGGLTASSYPLGITSGSDGALWFAEQSSSRIGRITATVNPADPTGLVAPSPTQTPQISWNASSGATSYDIYLNSTKIGTTTSTSYTDNSAPEGNDQYYIVANNSYGASNKSGIEVTVEHNAPTLGTPSWSINPTTVGQTTTLTIPLSDEYAGIGQVEYYIGSTDPGVGNATPANYNGTNIVLSIGSGLSAGTYNLNVRAKNSVGIWSSVTTTQLVVNPVQVPANLSAATPTNKAPVITWTADTDASSYVIYRDGSEIGTSTTPTFTDSFAGNGANAYNVYGVNAYGYMGTASSTLTVVYDNILPTITYSVSPAANTAGWNSTPVTVTFHCSVIVAGVIINSCTSPATVNANGSNQHITGTATDNAGNTSSITAVVNVDQSSPTLGTAFFTNSPIFYPGMSTLNVAVSDSLSGVAGGEYYIGTGTVPDGSGTHLNLGGSNLSATFGSNLSPGTYQVNYRAESVSGVWSSTQSMDIEVIPAIPTGVSSPSPVTNTAPVINWNTDTGASSYDVYRNGIEIGSTGTTSYVDSNAPQGSNKYSVQAVSPVGPVGSSSTVSDFSSTTTVIYDTVTPTITYTLSPAPNASGWNNSPVKVTFDCSTTVTGVVVSFCTSPVTLNTDGANQTVTGTVTDSAGNTANVTASVNLEQAAAVVSTPQLSASTIVDGQTSNITAPVSDGLSGVAGGEYYIGTDPGLGQGIAMNWDGTNLTATIGATLVPGTYQISVRAENVAGVWSGVETVQVIVSTIAPTNLTATASPTNVSPSISWSSASDASYYNVYRNGVDIGSTSSTSYSDTSAPQGINSYYVTSVSLGGIESVSSNSVYVNYETTPPTITYSLSTAPNSKGWNNTPVTVTFVCNTNVTGLSISSCTSPVTLSNDGANQTVTGTVNDNAGNTSSVTATVNIDQSNPTISYQLSATPNGAGWNNTPVTVTFVCNDAVSGVAVCSSPVTLTSDVANQTVTGSVMDNAGNSSNVTTVINLEQAAPVISAPLLSANPIVDGQTANLSATVSDNLSGVVGGEYYIDNDPGVGGGTPMTWDGTNLTSTLGSALAPGTYQINVRAENVAGVWSGVKTVQLIVNPVSPTNLKATSPTNQSPALSWTAVSDAAYYTVYRNGVSIGTSATATFTDNSASQGTSSYYVTSVSAGGTTSATSNTVNVNYETTPPTITYTLSASPNSNGWYNAPVTVTFHCTDHSGTGIAYCSSPQVLGGNGGDETSGVVGDNAGNTATSADVIVQVEVTPPTIGNPVVTSQITVGQTASLSVPASEQVAGVTGGEYFIGTDPGVGGGTPMTYNGTNLTANLGSNLAPGTYTVSVRAEDRASNWSNLVTTTLVVNAVQTPVNLTAASPTNKVPELTWSNGSDAVSYNVYRNGSDIGTSNTTSFNDTNAPKGNNSYYVTAVNAYGFESTPSNSVNVIYDTTAPTISYQLSQTPNGNGWFNSPVTVSFTCSSTVTGVTIASCSSPAVLSGDGANQQVTGTATDNAGNTSSTTATVSVDKTAPTLGLVSWSANPITVGGSSLLNVPTSDSLSGVVRGEYFIGTDPGVGNGISMNYSAGSISASIGSSLGVGTYSIGVRSLDAAGNWSAVTTTSLTVNAQKAAAPTNLSATSPTNHVPVLSWDASTGALSYNVYRNSVLVGSSSTAFYTDNSAPQGTSSYYVTAVNSGGESLASNTISVLFDTTAPTISFNLSQAPNAAGWENSPVIVTFNCNDAVTTISTCTSPITVSTDGANQHITGTATDAAGNTASVTANINLDQSLPTVGAPVLATNPITVGQTTTLTDTTSDNISGVIGGEYFIGTTDPGNGAGIPMTLSSGNLSATIGSGLSTGTYQVNVRTEDAAGNWSVISTTNLVVNPVSVLPAFASGASATTSTGTALSFAVTASGTPSPAITESGTLPTGVKFTGGNGTATLSGTPAAGTNGTYTLTFTATNTAGKVTQTFTLTITSTTSAPKVTSAASVTVKYGAAMTPFAVTSSGNPAPTLSSTALPSGLKFTNNANGTATISGTPSNGISGAFAITITAKNSAGSATQTFTIYVDKAPTFSSVISNKLVAVIGSTFSLSTSSTGYPVPTVTETGTLPKGLTFTTSNGNVTLSGTPAASTTGTYTIKLTATNSFGSTTETFTIYVYQAPVITNASSSIAKVGTAYKFQITSTGSPAPYYFIVGTLPKGLTYSVTTGLISGTPAAGSAGTYKFTIYAINIVGLTSQSFTLTVQ